FHRHLLEVPFADGPQVAAMGGDDAVDRAVVLARIELLVLFGGVIQDLHFAHAHVGRVAVAGVADGQAVVSAGREPVFDTGHEVAVLVPGVYRAALVRLANDGAVLHLVLIHGAGPPREVLAVKDRLEALRAVLAQDGVGLGCWDLADEHISPADFAAVGLQLDRRLFQEGLLAVPEVLEPGVIDDELVVEKDRHALADHQDAKRIPLAKRFVGQDERVLARRARAMVPQAAAGLVGPDVSLAAFLGVVPDLYLRRRAEIDAAVGLWHGLVLDEQLDVAEIFIRGQVGPVAVVDQFAIIHGPVLLGVLGPLLHLGLT